MGQWSARQAYYWPLGQTSAMNSQMMDQSGPSDLNYEREREGGSRVKLCKWQELNQVDVFKRLTFSFFRARLCDDNKAWKQHLFISFPSATPISLPFCQKQSDPNGQLK